MLISLGSQNERYNKVAVYMDYYSYTDPGGIEG